MKKSTKNILIGAGIATAVGAITTAIICQLRVIKKLTADIDEIPDEDAAVEELADEEVTDEATDEVAEDAAVEEVSEEA